MVDPSVGLHYCFPKVWRIGLFTLALGVRIFKRPPADDAAAPIKIGPKKMNFFKHWSKSDFGSGPILDLDPNSA